MIDQGYREQEAHIADFAIGLVGTGGVPIPTDSLLPFGAIEIYAGVSAPPLGWLFCLGQTVNRADYPFLYGAIARSATVTLTAANPCVVSWTAHGLAIQSPVIFYTTGALPAPLVAGQVYYVAATSYATDSFTIASTPGGAAISTLGGTQSGVHTGVYAPFGDGDGSTTFKVPDLRGLVVAGGGGLSAGRLTGQPGGVNGNVIGAIGGEEVHTLVNAEVPANLAVNTMDASGAVQVINSIAHAASASQAHNNVQPTIVLNYIIWAGFVNV